MQNEIIEGFCKICLTVRLREKMHVYKNLDQMIKEELNQRWLASYDPNPEFNLNISSSCNSLESGEEKQIWEEESDNEQDDWSFSETLNTTKSNFCNRDIFIIQCTRYLKDTRMKDNI
jgi:hypothetical protein